jgi:hypothetical protein
MLHSNCLGKKYFRFNIILECPPYQPSFVYLLHVSVFLNYSEKYIKITKKYEEYVGTNKKQTPWPLVRKRTLSTERPPLIDEI